VKAWVDADPDKDPDEEAPPAGEQRGGVSCRV